MKRREIQLRVLKRRFVWSRILRGAITIVALLGVIWLIGYMFEGSLSDLKRYLNEIKIRILDNELAFYSVYLFSEILSILPPEIFILPLERSIIWRYALDVAILSLLSYIAGILTYLIGVWMGQMRFFKRFIYRFYKRELRQLKRFGGVLVVLSALTPVPYALICLLVGSSGRSFQSFWIYAASRFLRFIVLGYLIWQISFTTAG